jgi:5'-3' exoribonuclease 2
VPGEGEHKIIDFIRHQRLSSSYDPKTVHCLCSADADLIMLGLATHESNFNILREEFVPNQKEKNFIFIRLPVLREYLERELTMPNLPFPYDLERAIDDWVFFLTIFKNKFKIICKGYDVFLRWK